MLKAIISIFFGLIYSQAQASCPDLYPNGTPVTVPSATELCNLFYVVLYDQKNNHPVLSSEKLKSNVAVGSTVRSGNFRVDRRLLVNHSPSMYINSGFDRGHLAAADNASNPQEALETYWMSNVTPQNPKLNRGAWKALETRIRTRWQKSGADLWIVTIPVYGAFPLFLASKIPIPSGYWKVVIDEKTTTFYYADNSETASIENVRYFDWVSYVNRTN
jgi:endonuclease G